MKILKKSEAEKINISKKNNLEEWCKRNNRLDLLEEWDYEKNDIGPYEISYGSNKPVYWICKNHHSYEKDIHNRTSKNTGCAYCSNQKILPGYNDFKTWCKKNNREELLIEWDYEKNIVKPTEISYSSREPIWWKCEKQHSYDIRLKERTLRNYSCPYCSNHRILKGFNDFKTWCMENDKEYLLKEWDYEKNEMNPDEIVYTHSNKIWWTCECGHSYHAMLSSRILNNTGCTYCTNQKVLTGFNDFASWCIKNDKQYFLKEWDYVKNTIKPTKVMRGNKDKFWWICEKGHSYQSSLNSRTSRNSGCPYCSNNKVLEGYNDFKTWCKQNNREELIVEWDYIMNKLKPTEVIKGNRGKIWWTCRNHQSYPSSTHDRIRGKGCPICQNRRVLKGYNDFETWCKQNNRKALLEEWDYTTNTIKPAEITYGSRANIDWICKDCGCKWNSNLKNRTINRAGCPHCNQSKGEKKITEYFLSHSIKFKPQYKFINCKNKNLLSYDFAIFINRKILLVEYDGEQHFRPVAFNGKMDDAKKQFAIIKKRDKIKTKFSIDNDIPLLRIPYTKFNDIEELLEDFIKRYE